LPAPLHPPAGGCDGARGGGPGGGPSSGGDGKGTGGKDDVIDAEFTETPKQ